MPDCKLSIEFDNPSRQYAAGDTVSGRVLVQSDDDVTCNGLSVTCCWQTHGRGDKDTGANASEIVFNGQWVPGQRYEYSFSFELPLGPATYHGNLINVDWYIQARADVPWAFDPKCEEDFIVTPGARSRPGVAAPEYHPGQSAKTTTAGPVTTLMIGLGFLTGAGGCAYWWYNTGDIFPIILGSVFGLIGVIATVGGIQGLILRRHIGSIVFDIEPKWTTPGGTTHCLLTLRPKKATRINGVRAVLTCCENATYRSGTDSTTVKHELHEETIALHDGAQLQAGELFEVQGDVPIPADARYSFNGDNNTVAWVIELRIDIDGLPDWAESREVTVTY